MSTLSARDETAFVTTAVAPAAEESIRAARTGGPSSCSGTAVLDQRAGQSRERPHAEADPAPLQPIAEQIPSARQVGRQRALGNAELPSRFAPRLALDLAGHQRDPVTVRQAIQLLVQDRKQILPVVCGLRLGLRRLNHKSPLSRELASDPAAGPRLARSAHRIDAVEPARQSLFPHDRRGPPRQDEECRLEGILRIVRARQHPPAHSQHHRPIPRDQGRERILGVAVAPARGTAPATRRRSGRSSCRCCRVCECLGGCHGSLRCPFDATPRCDLRMLSSE